METLSNFKLVSEGSLTQACLDKELHYFNQVIDYVHQLPYGRNSDRNNLMLILTEQKGTCSTKHAFLAQVAIENGSLFYQLYLGLYKMDAGNTPGVGRILEKYSLQYIPEAHTYIKDANGQYIDVTRTIDSDLSFKDSIIKELVIRPSQIGAFKIEWHQEFLTFWNNKQQSSYTTNELWEIREECIANLS